jgi:ketosteroid isomerase-like protein
MGVNRRITPDHMRATADRIRRKTADMVSAYASGNVEAAAAFFAHDVVYMPADRPALLGIEALRHHFELTFAAGISMISFVREDFMASGEIALDRGRYHRRVPRGRFETLEQRGTYSATWRIQRDGQYRVTSLIFGQATVTADASGDGQG